MKELDFNQLTTKQKIGMSMVGCFTIYNEKNGNFDEELSYILRLIREHCLGAVWVDVRLKRRDEVIAAVKETADYPILIITDAENGLDEFQIGKHNSIGVTDSEDLAYTFGKVVGVTAYQMGYNVVCNPVLEIQRGSGVCGKNVRALGSDKEKVTALAAKISEGMHDGGVLSFAKHYPSSNNTYNIDSHMAEAYSEDSLDTVIGLNLYPYFELMKKDLLDGIMTQHFKLATVDPEHPASLSRKTINLIRERGFDGVAITDAMCMMGIVAKYGKTESKGMAIEAGNDLMLPWEDNMEAYEALCECYEKGILSEEALNDAVRRVLKAQRKTLNAPKNTSLTDEDIVNFNKINTDSIYEYLDEGITSKLSHDGRHFFAIQVLNEAEISDKGKVSVDTFNNGWYYPNEIIEKLEKLFPNSKTCAIREFPSPAEIQHLLEESVDYEDVVFITFVETNAYVGKECLTSRIVSMMEAMQVSNRISTLLHFGNPYVLEELPHIPRVVVGCLSKICVDTSLDVLAGLYEAKGVATYDIHLK